MPSHTARMTCRSIAVRLLAQMVAGVLLACATVLGVAYAMWG